MTDTVASPTESPVFVDTTGRRRRRIRRAAFALTIGVCAYGAVVVISLLGGPVPPNVLLPLPGSANGPASARTAASASPHAAATRAGAVAGPGSGTGAATSRAGAPVASPTPATAATTAPAAASPSASASRVPPGLSSRSASPGATGHRH